MFSTYNIVVPPSSNIAIIAPPPLAATLSQQERSQPPPAPAGIFELRSAGDKGLGLFATAHIPAGGLILVEHPAIITPSVLHGTHSPLFDQLKVTMCAKEREGLLKMDNCRPSSECGDVEGVVRTNGTTIDLGTTEFEFGGVYLMLNRANHSCGPNAAFKWDLNTLSASLYAVRDIEPSDEICMTYAVPTAPASTRLAHLQSTYAFTCSCPHCSLPLPLRAQSDEDRASLACWRATHPTFVGWVRDMCRDDNAVLDSHFEALRLIKQEGMEAMQALFFEDIAMCYGVLGDEENFKMWAEKTIALLKVPDPVRAQTIARWIEDKGTFPNKLWAWRRKERLKLQKSKKATLEEPPSPLLHLFIPKIPDWDDT